MIDFNSQENNKKSPNEQQVKDNNKQHILFKNIIKDLWTQRNSKDLNSGKTRLFLVNEKYRTNSNLGSIAEGVGLVV